MARSETEIREEREALIAKSTQGATPSRTDIDIARNREEFVLKYLAGLEADRRQFGYHPELSSEHLRDFEKTKGRGR